MNLSNFVQQSVSGETVIRWLDGAVCDPPFRLAHETYQVSGLCLLWQYSPRFSLPYPPQWPESFLILCWMFSSWAGQWEARTPLAVLWLPRAHGQSSGSQHKPGPQKGVLSGGMKDFRQLWEQPSQYLARLNKIFLRPIISIWWSCSLHNFDGCFSVGKRNKSQPHEV